MSLNALFKAALISLGLVTLVACSSTEDTDTSGATTTTVETVSSSNELSAEEQERLRLEELRKNHVVYFEFDKSDILDADQEILRAHAG